MTTAASSPSSTGRLCVIRRASDGACVASELHATYPLRLHVVANDPRPSSPKALCCYLIGFGGGIVSGDDVDLKVCVGENAALLVTSQSTSKAFRSVAGRPMSKIQTTISVHPGALMVWSPQPTQCFKKSKLSQSVDVILHLPDTTLSPTDNLAPSLVLVDWYTGGRRNLDDGGWQLDCLKTSTTVSYTKHKDRIDQQEMIFRDASMISGCTSLQRHMRNFHIVAMMILVGPRVQKIAQELLSQYSSRGTYDSAHNNHHDIHKSVAQGFLVSCGTFPLGNHQPNQNGVLVRIASHSLEQVARFLSMHIGTLDDQLAYDPFSEIVISSAANYNNPMGSEQQMHAADDTLLPVDEVDSNLIRSWELCQRPPSTTCQDNNVNRSLLNAPSLLYQLVDASTPTGGFSHSNTLEVAMQAHFVQSSQDLFYYAWDFLLQTHTCMVPFLMKACSIFLNSNNNNNNCAVDEWDQLDQALAVTVTSHVTTRASCFQGSALLRAYGQTFPEIGAVVKLLRKRIQVSPNPHQRGHAATCFGAVCGLLHVVDERTAVSMFMYITARDMINAAVRLNLVGPLQGSQLVHHLCTKFDDWVLKKLDVTSISLLLDPTDQAYQVAPLIEILANAHDRLYTRLFNS